MLTVPIESGIDPRKKQPYTGPIEALWVAPAEAFSDIRARAAAAVRTGAILQGELGPDAAEGTATSIFKENITEPMRLALNAVAQGATIPTATQEALTATAAKAIKINALLTAYDMEIVQNAVRLRNYVTNRLIEESNGHDANIRMRALIALGKITDVGLFTEKTEITIKDRSEEELSEMLRKKLQRLVSTKDAEDANEVTPEMYEAKD